MSFFIAIEYATMEPLQMCKLTMVCKQANAIMPCAWPHIEPPSSFSECSNSVCCCKPTLAWGMCNKCIQAIKLISTTQTKEDSLLKPAMLKLLKYKESQSSYKCSQVICMYRWQDVVELALCIHKSLQKKGPSKAKITRKQAVEKHMQQGCALHAMQQSQKAWDKCAAPYVTNGSGVGVSCVICAFKQFTHQQLQREALQAKL